MGVGDLTIGPGSVVEQLLEDYGLNVDSVAGDLVESDTDRLLLALLLEQRGADNLQSASIDSTANDGRGSSSSAYFSGTIQSAPNPVDDDDQPIEPDFQMTTIVVRSFASPIFIAFGEPTSATDRIQLDPEAGDEPYVVSPGNDWSTDEIFVGVPDGGSATSVTVEGFE